MLTYIQYNNGRLREIDVPDSCQIVRVVNPSPEELEHLAAVSQAPMDFLTAATDRDERPRLEVEDGCQLIVIRVPHRVASEDAPFITLAFAIVLTPNLIITVCSEASTVWHDVLALPRSFPCPSNRLAFLSAFFLQVARQYLGFLKQIREQSDAVENAIHGSMKNEMLIRLLSLEKCLVYFTTSLRANDPIWDRFRRLNGRELTPEEQALAGRLTQKYEDAAWTLARKKDGFPVE